jgi:hypothetical protein
MTKFRFVLLALAAFASAPAVALGGTISWKTLTEPDGSAVTPEAISGNLVVGIGNGGSFMYNIAANAWTTGLQFPQRIATDAFGTDGSSIVGNMQKGDDVFYGFTYKIATNNWTEIDEPSAYTAGGAFDGTFPTGVSGNTVVGYYRKSLGVYNAFIYNTTTSIWTSVADAGHPTEFLGISGNFVLGEYWQNNGVPVPSVYNLTSGTWTDFPDDPFASIPGSTNPGYTPTGIDGNNIVGNYSSPSNPGGGYYEGDLYNRSANVWSGPFVDPTSNTGTLTTGISGNHIIGFYTYGNNGNQAGFVATLPEPSSLCLVVLGGIALIPLATGRWRPKIRQA